MAFRNLVNAKFISKLPSVRTGLFAPNKRGGLEIYNQWFKKKCLIFTPAVWLIEFLANVNILHSQKKKPIRIIFKTKK